MALVTTMSIREGKIIDGPVAFFALHDFMRYLDTLDSTLSLWDSTVELFLDRSMKAASDLIT